MKIFDLSKIIVNVRAKSFSKRIALLVLLLSPVTCHLSHAHAIGMKELGDSLMVWTGFARSWSPTVRVKQLRINGDEVTLKTNLTLHDVRWTPDNVAEVKRKVSVWTLGHENGTVTIYTGSATIDELITDCARSENHQSPITNNQSDLTDRNIVLYPSHGLYFNRDRQQWIWQRATLWTTVEDLYSHEYVRRVSRMLENAGARVLSPRAGLDQQALGASGMPQWTEGARYWLESQGADSSVWKLYDGNEYKDDMKSRGTWVNSLQTPVDLCIALHTDGFDSGNDSTIVGTLAIYTAKDDDGNTTLRDGSDREKTNRNLADWIQTSVTNDLKHWNPEWTRRQLKEANYCESRMPVVPSIILELLSHKNMADMKYGLNPAFRFAAARAVYKGILRYLNGPNAIVQPLPVQELSVNAEGLLRWLPQLDSLESSAVPTYYMVYIQANDGEWDVQQVEKKTELQLDLKPNVKYNFYVAAGNDGGLSMPSPIISAYLNHQSPILIIDAFDDVYGPEWFADSTYAGIVPGSYACEDGFSCAYIGQQWDYVRSSKWLNDDNCGFGACYRDFAGRLTIGNTHDYAAQHGHVLRKMRISYVSCTAGMAQVDSTYALIDVVCGRQRQPLSDTLRSMLADYLTSGGKLLMSTDHFSAIEPAWAKQYLHATYHAPRATRSGRINSPRHRLYQLQLEPNEEQLFTCTPEALRPVEDAQAVATYEDMRCTAGVGYQSPITNDQLPMTKTLVYGFPLEAVMDFEKIFRHAVEWLFAE